MRKRDVAKIDKNGRAEGMVNPVRDSDEGRYIQEGGTGRHEDTCGRGLSRRPLRLPLRVKL